MNSYVHKLLAVTMQLCIIVPTEKQTAGNYFHVIGSLLPVIMQHASMITTQVINQL